MHIIEIIKNRRDVLNLTQESLSELSGVGLRTLKQLEIGKGNPTLSTLEKLVDTLGLEIYIQVRKINN
jgi:transcriptional regulator with XRE-family HTH domain